MSSAAAVRQWTVNSAGGRETGHGWMREHFLRGAAGEALSCSVLHTDEGEALQRQVLFMDAAALSFRQRVVCLDLQAIKGQNHTAPVADETSERLTRF